LLLVKLKKERKMKEKEEFSAVELIREMIENVGTESAYELADNFTETLETEYERQIHDDELSYRYAKILGGFKGSTTMAIMVLLEEIEKLSNS
jgi:hypothetical protein